MTTKQKIDALSAVFAKDELHYFVERLAQGLQEIATVQDKLKVFEPELFKEDVVNEIRNLSKEKETFQNRVLDSLATSEEKRSMQQLLGVSDQAMHALYRVSVEIYNERRFKEAAAAFSVIAVLDPWHFDAWMALGNAEYFCHRYRGALIAYAMAMHCNPKNPFSHVYSAACYEKIKEYDNAIQSLDTALFVIHENPEYKELALNIKEQKQRLKLI